MPSRHSWKVIWPAGSCSGDRFVNLPHSLEGIPLSRNSISTPALAQVAMCSCDLPKTVRFYTEVLGFADSGGSCLYGPWGAAIQELGEDMSAVMWWLTGRQSLFQLEIFAHTQPAQRPLSSKWKPNDLGWSRWGVAVSDFERCLQRLASAGVATITEPADFGDGVRRVCFQEPFTRVVVEILEDSPAIPGGQRTSHFTADPAVIYAAISVPDLQAAKAFFVDGLAMKEEPKELQLHTPEMEKLWGLAGAESCSAVVRAGDVYLEMVEYSNPAGRSLPADHRLSDQGFMNIALAYPARSDLDDALARVAELGAESTVELGPPDSAVAATYLRGPGGLSVEVGSIRAGAEALIGFVPRPSVGEALS
jgi:catechol 2,3-dioxygenase-like lactoylglutathione lyase family enzyme